MSRTAANYAELYSWKPDWDQPASGSAPAWYVNSPAELRDPAYIQAQAVAGFPARAAEIGRLARALPHPIELMVIARPPGDHHAHPAHVLDIVRRMAGRTHHELAAHIGMDRADLTRWVRKPLTDGPGPARLEQLWQLLGVDPAWATSGSHASAPAWLQPWIAWDATARAAGHRETIAERKANFAAVYAEYQRITLAGYGEWCAELHAVMERFPARSERPVKEQRALNKLVRAYEAFALARTAGDAAPAADTDEDDDQPAAAGSASA